MQKIQIVSVSWPFRCTCACNRRGGAASIALHSSREDDTGVRSHFKPLKSPFLGEGVKNGYAKKAFLITGGAGFIGSHLAEVLLRAGHTVLVIDDLSTGEMGNIEHLLSHRNFHFARASITDALVMDRLASVSDVIIHLAAAVGVKLIVERPVHTIETNVMGTQAVLKAALRYRCRTLLASSSEVYGKGKGPPFGEEDDVVLGPTSKCRWAYAQSKMIDESLGLAYQREYGLDVVAFRLFNTVGPRQTDQYGMVIPTFIRQALRGNRSPFTETDPRGDVSAMCAMWWPPSRSWRRGTGIRGKCSISEVRRRRPFSGWPGKSKS